MIPEKQLGDTYPVQIVITDQVAIVGGRRLEGARLAEELKELKRIFPGVTGMIYASSEKTGQAAIKACFDAGLGGGETVGVLGGATVEEGIKEARVRRSLLLSAGVDDDRLRQIERLIAVFSEE